MINYQEIQKQFNEVLAYSQDFNEEILHTTPLLEKWAEAKETFYHAFGDKLIYNAGHTVVHLSPEKRKEKLRDFIDSLQYYGSPYDNSQGELIRLADFIRSNEASFYENIVSYPTEVIKPDGDTFKITVGMKLSRAFKYFISNAVTLDRIQTQASMLIQEDCIEGDLCFSIHPLDFLSSSENNYNWRSCHALDGEYRSGNLSYMMDSCTIITYIKGKDDIILPHFPKTVPWNSKKWRMLLFTSKNRTCLFAGRQYPMDLGYGILDILLTHYCNIYPHLAHCAWSNWHDDKITNFNYSNDVAGRDSGYLSRGHVIINGYIYNIRKIIKDVEGSKHFNDLLNSSCYTPRYCWYKNTKYIPEFDIGGEIPCPVCGTRSVDYNDGMYCENCGDRYGYGEGYVTCSDCGRRISEEDAYWVDSIGGYICYDCYSDNYFTCDRCGEIHSNDECHEYDGCYYCDYCYERVKPEED